MHSVTKKRQLLGDEGGLRPPDPLGPLLSHILNTPLSIVLVFSIVSYNKYTEIHLLFSEGTGP